MYFSIRLPVCVSTYVFPQFIVIHNNGFRALSEGRSFAFSLLGLVEQLHERLHQAQLVLQTPLEENSKTPSSLIRANKAAVIEVYLLKV